ncbi:unnamed protein product [Owenia fusiformis]|uniref:HEAT repeat-containing protein 1 n=1 Tax=Owenia fusiformis TaxID=6347 RepID=A0A8J1XR40_OWEFU|nr:unnamed protein product [Owenia fusiformis]
MTSLAKQLERLAVPQIQATLADDRQKASLLFEPTEAALIDKETFYALGVNGLEQLINLDNVFMTFEDTLFNKSSITFQRSIQMKEVNDRLDGQIKEFLLRVSPYFLMTPAQKAMEWLIYRYQMHIYNIDELLMCILPYHETKIFTRAIQLIKLDNPASRWHWLSPIQKPGFPLARSTVINHCAKDPSFMTFLCDMIPQYMKVYGKLNTRPIQVVFSFYATTILGALQAQPVTDTILAHMLPYLTRGCKSKCTDYQAATYMILAQLMTVTKVKFSLLEKLMPALTKHIKLELASEVIGTLVVICQTQKVEKLPKKTFKHMCKLPGVLQHLENVSTSSVSDNLIGLFLERLIPAALKGDSLNYSATSSDGESELSQGPPQYASLLLNLLTDLPLSHDVSHKVAKTLLEAYLDKMSEEMGDDESAVNEKFKPLLKAMQSRYPVAMDLTLEEAIKDQEKDYDPKLLREFSMLGSATALHSLMPSCDSGLFLSLKHPTAAVRILAVKHLGQLLKEKQVEIGEDKDSLCSAILDRLQDDQPDVVHAVLQLEQVLFDVCEGQIEELYKVLEDITTKNEQQTKWSQVINLILDLRLNKDTSNVERGTIEKKTLFSVLKFLYMTKLNEANMTRMTLIVKSKFVAQHPLLKNISKDWLKILKSGKDNMNKLISLNQAVVQDMAAAIGQANQKFYQHVDDLCEAGHLQEDNLPLVWLILCILTHPSTNKTQNAFQGSHDQSSAFGLLRKFLERFTKKDMFIEVNSEKQLHVVCTESIASHGHIHFSAVVFLLKQVLKGMGTASTSLKSQTWWDFVDSEENSKYIPCLLELFDILLEWSTVKGNVCKPAFQELIQMYLQTFFPEEDKSQLYKFLSYVWSTNGRWKWCETPGPVSPVFQARALYIGSVIIGTNPKLAWKSHTVLASLLVALSSPEAQIRQGALQCLAEMEKGSPGTASMYPLVKKLVICQEEIIADQTYVKQAVGVLFYNLDPNNQSKQTPKRQKKALERRNALDALLEVVLKQDTPDYIQANLLDVLSVVNGKNVLSQLIPLLDALTQVNNTTLSEYQRASIEQIIQKYTSETVPLLGENKTCLEILLKCLHLSDSFTYGEGCNRRTYPSIQQLVLTQLSKETYAAFPEPSIQQRILSDLIDLWSSCKDADVALHFSKCIKKLSFTAREIAVELRKLESQEVVTSLRHAKKLKRTSNQKEDKEKQQLDGAAWKRVTLILELLQSKKKLLEGELLIPVLFSTLANCLEVETQSLGEYQKQLILSCLHNVCTQLATEGESNVLSLLDTQEFNVSLLVQCIRTSENPQTHHHALLVLSLAAGLFPDHVLHNIMAIFTFMGANTMRQDDTYSFQVIFKTIETVIPALIMANEKRGVESIKLNTVVSGIIQVFTNAYPHIPTHRTLPLFEKLLLTVGPQRFLWSTVLLLVESHISRAAAQPKAAEEQENRKTGELPAEMDFVVKLCCQFDPSIIVESCEKSLKYLRSLPVDKEAATKVATPARLRKNTPAGNRKEQEFVIFDMNNHSSRHFRQFQYIAVNLVIAVLSCEEFIGKVAMLDDTCSIEIEPLYQSLLEENLKFMHRVAQVTDEQSQTPASKFWRILLHKAYDILDKVNSLMPGKVFIQVVSGLMASELPLVRRKAMELLNAKLYCNKDAFTEEQESKLLEMVDQLVFVAKTEETAKGEPSELAINRQTALFSLKMISKVFGEDNPETFKPVLAAVTTLFSKEESNPQLAASALQCLAELCDSMGPHTLPYMGKFMPALLKVLKHQADGSNELLQLSAVTALHKVLFNLHNFISPYLAEVIKRVIAISSAPSKESSAYRVQLQLRLKAVKQRIAAAIPARVLVPTIESCYSNIVDKDVSRVQSLLEILGDHITNLNKEDLKSYHSAIFNFFLVVLDYRVLHTQSESADLDAVEASASEAVMSLVMKLSEASFRPMFFKLYDWATRNDASTERLLTFYRLVDRFADGMKALFNLFAGHIIKNTADLLDKTNCSKTDELLYKDVSKNVQLCGYILDTLHKVCRHDTEGFLNKERFDTLMQPLIDQLENEEIGEDLYEAHVTEHLVPCIAQFAVAIADDSLWKPMNYQICLQTRHSSSKVRFAALRVLQAIGKQLGESYMVLLPETIPFLAELMEDESLQVENLCKEVVGEMEKILGEPLQKYF